MMIRTATGQIVDLPTDEAVKLIESGQAVPVTEQQLERATERTELETRHHGTQAA